ncbi:aldehyde dehydrogenase [Actinomadura algeriensis]|uniref:Acyl-CoA reductase-like NAD-dependent aldehyde dehydrogenase n=1 Tax=Actinomadura algeriensis TaxID=1679523 RepID=A0ABR9K2M9_9ACTN|nr:aldehyde dehydrogenase [Actinomadura algeriensis]MBE1537111.1 acyl-CoA reductase-like NAD-dependent aldehyde dehydrogenase [Actinomadura algeriensis]
MVEDRLMHRREFFIGGGWRAPAGGDRLGVVSPSTEEVVGEVPVATTTDVDRAVDAARTAFEDGPWPRASPAGRAEVLARAAEALRGRERDIAEITVEEMGCAIGQAAKAQTGMVAALFDHYANLVRDFAFEREVTAGDRVGLVTNEPVGVVAAIVPWNAPVTLAAWKVAPALAAGCTVVLKPPPEAPLSNFVLAEALAEAGVPDGVVSVVPGDREVGEHLVTHPETDKVAFTGSTAAGKRIMSLCGERVTRVSLELGGKSAAIVLDDADVPDVMPRLVGAAMHLSGQVCGAHTRVLLPRSRYAEAVEAAAAAAKAVPVGDPHDPATLVGPLVAERQRDRVEGYIALAVEAGARVAAGGGRPARLPKGWYVEPTILADVDNSMRVAREEIFGPVLCLIPYDDDDDAVRIANDSPYGLAGGVWTGDARRALRVARRIRTGSVSINGSAPPFPAVPFGGFKESGLGRELGPEGLRSFLEPRSIGISAPFLAAAR